MIRRLRTRAILIQLHLWLGLTIGAVWALQGATGALLSFHREAARTFGISGSGGPPASLDAIVAAARAGGAETIRRIGIRDASGDVLQVDHEERGIERTMLVDTATAHPLADRLTDPSRPDQGFWRWVFQLHEALLLGPAGEGLIGGSGILLFSTTILGLWIGWPRRGQWRAAFALGRLRTAAQRLYGWHRAFGLVAGFGLLLMASSGVWMAFAPDLRPVVARLVRFDLPGKPPPPHGASVIGPQQALSKVLAAYPGAAFVRITLPTKTAGVYVLRLRQAGEPRLWAGTTSVTIDANTGAVLSSYDALHAPLANRVADFAFPLHTGEAAGLAGRVAVMLLGLSLPFFYGTGLLAWARKRRRRGSRYSEVP